MPRNLLVDKAICEAATPGPWGFLKSTNSAPDISGNGRRIARVLYHNGSEDSEVISNANFICAARTGWPETIQQLINAEADLATMTMLVDEHLRTVEQLKVNRESVIVSGGQEIEKLTSENLQLNTRVKILVDAAEILIILMSDSKAWEQVKDDDLSNDLQTAYLTLRQALSKFKNP
jgi:hypothetical protein